MYSSNECPPGQFYSVAVKECRECELICGDQYGGSATAECQNNCPGYGQSTHATTSVTELPSFESDSLPWWIWVLIASLVTLAVLIIILVVCLKKPRKCQKKWLQATDELDSPGAEDVGFVTQESNQSGKAVMVVS